MTTRFNIPRYKEHYTGLTLAQVLALNGQDIEEKTVSEWVSTVTITATLSGGTLAAMNAIVDAAFVDTVSNGGMVSD